MKVDRENREKMFRKRQFEEKKSFPGPKVGLKPGVVSFLKIPLVFVLSQ